MQVIGSVIKKIMPRRYVPKRNAKIHEAILKTLAALAQKNRKPYVSVPQNVLCELVGKYYRVPVSRRTLNYHLRFLENNGYIRRIRRITRDAYGRLITMPTLYILMSKAQKFLKGLVKFARKIGNILGNVKQVIVARELVEKWKKDPLFLRFLTPAQKSRVILEIATYSPPSY